MSMSDRDGYIWYDGKLVNWRDATTHVLTHTLHYGMGVFEGVRAYHTPKGTAIFRLQDHTDRLFRSAHILGMNMPYSKDEINEAQRAAVRENKLESAYIRPMAKSRLLLIVVSVRRARSSLKYCLILVDL
jgi:branched-chain amino acid aminotransferase